ncbi:MAG: hypothetical protein A2269_07650, partial [Lentisphaerae bacterium RIFOXYA12_FULL_60_10]
DAFGFLSEEVKQAEQSLNQAGEALQKFRESSGNIGLDQSADNQPVLARLKTLNNEFTAVQLQRIDLEAKRMVVENLLQGSVSNQNNFIQTIIAIPFIREDAAVMENLGRLATVDKQLAAIENVYGAQHPQLLAARAERIRVSNELEQVLRATVQSLGNRLETLRGQESEISAQLESQRIEAVALARDAFEFGRLQAEVDRQRQIYDTLMARMMEIDVTSGFMRTNVEIVEEALLPKAPIRPNRSRMATMSAFFGLILGLALGFVLEHLDDTVKTPEDLREKLGVSLLGFVPLMKGIPAEGASMGVLTATEPLSSIAEAYRSIRTSLFYSIPAGHAKVLVFTSCGPGEGKTTTAGNLAVAMALSGKRTLLIDADLHRPAVHHLFNLERETGLTSILVGDATLEQSLCQVELPTGPIPNLYVVTGGPDSPNPGELIGSSTMAALIQEAGTRYDWVIVDTPPVFFVSDTCVLGAMADGVVLVVRVGVNNRSHLHRLRQHLEQMNIRIVGAILNRVVVSRMGRYFSDYYYHGYSRYAKDYHKSYYPSAQKSTRRVKSSVPAGMAMEPVEFFPPAPVDPSPAMPEAVVVQPPVEQPVADGAETVPMNPSGDAGPAAPLPVSADEGVNLPVEPVKEPDVMPERPLAEPVPVPPVEVVDRKDTEPAVPLVPSGDGVRSEIIFAVQEAPSVQPVETPVESTPIPVEDERPAVDEKPVLEENPVVEEMPVVEEKPVKDDTLRPAFVMESVAGKVSDLKERLSGMESSYQQFEKRLQLLAKKRQSKPESK